MIRSVIPHLEIVEETEIVAIVDVEMRKTVTADAAEDPGAVVVAGAAPEVGGVEALAIGGGAVAEVPVEAAAEVPAEVAAGAEAVIVTETGLLGAIAIVTVRGGPTESHGEVTNLQPRQ